MGRNAQLIRQWAILKQIETKPLDNDSGHRRAARGFDEDIRRDLRR